MTATSQIHPLTGTDYRQPIYIARDGTPRYMIGGGSEPAGVEETPPNGTPPAETPPAETPPVETPPAETPPADQPPAPDNVKTFDAEYVKKLRDEAAKNRTQGQQATAVLEAINKVLNPDAPDEKVDPVKLQEQLTTTSTSHTNLQREHQVLLSAIAAGADHATLLDSRSFLAKIAQLDPSADDFAASVKTAVDAAVKENPKLKTGQVPSSSSADHAGGAGGGGAKPTTLEDAVTAKMAVG